MYPTRQDLPGAEVQPSFPLYPCWFNSMSRPCKPQPGFRWCRRAWRRRRMWSITIARRTSIPQPPGREEYVRTSWRWWRTHCCLVHLSVIQGPLDCGSLHPLAPWSLSFKELFTMWQLAEMALRSHQAHLTSVAAPWMPAFPSSQTSQTSGCLSSVPKPQGVDLQAYARFTLLVPGLTSWSLSMYLMPSMALFTSGCLIRESGNPLVEALVSQKCQKYRCLL